jgi:hypothetical protein
MPLGYEVFAGNRADVTMVEKIVSTWRRGTGGQSASGSWTAG